MKAILISIKPKYAADILNGKKTLEIRKTMPKCDLPIEVYIYYTKAPLKNCSIDDIALYCMGSGKVVAKFTLNKVEMVEVGTQEDHIKGLYQGFYSSMNTDELLNKTCINSCATILEYAGFDFKHNDNFKCWRKNIYAWHIDDLVIFDKPKELSEFKSYKKNIVNTKINGMVFETELDNSLIKAPQSWCYVEV